ncbi:MAG: phage major capsid protein, partial [Cyanobacteria bacterium HKST-UBA06]|nr:phage major capsid protein [Cyanobacteria bacterium HKST-UBA06]
TETPEIGMDESDLKRYSMTRAIQAIVEGDFKGRAGFEYECSLEAMKKTSAVPRAGNRGFLVPYDVLAKREVHAVNQRDLVVGTSTAGGHLVATNLLASSFIDLLRNKMVIMQAGATMLPDMVGNIAIPRQTGGATAYWLAENGAVTESQQAFDQVAMSPKTVGAYTDISRLLLKQSSIGLEDFVKGDLSTTLALAIDLAAIHGSGSSNQPTGIIATSGIGSVALGTNGAAPDRDTLIDLETEVAIDNADLGTLAYMTNTKVRGKLKKTATDSGSGLFVWDNTDTPTNGYRALVTNQVSSALTKGTSSGVCSAILFGNWADLILAFWGGLDIEVDPYSQSTTGAVRIVAFQSLDVAVRHPQSFAACLDALTA